MPQSKDFWAWAKHMREREAETPEDQRVYLCILYLDRFTKDEINLEEVMSSLDSSLNHLEHNNLSRGSDEDNGQDWSTTALSECDPKRRTALSNTPAALLRKGLHVSMPKIIKKWHEIGTVNRHWAIEVRGNIYELRRKKDGSSKLSKRPVAETELKFRKRLTARLYVGQTHMTDKVIEEIGRYAQCLRFLHDAQIGLFFSSNSITATGLMKLQKYYELQMDNCQHFATVLLPRILCPLHCHMTVMPSASLPYVKHSEFGLLQAGVKSGQLSTIYYRFLHQTKYVVWQHSVYCERSLQPCVRRFADGNLFTDLMRRLQTARRLRAEL